MGKVIFEISQKVDVTFYYLKIYGKGQIPNGTYTDVIKNLCEQLILVLFTH